MVIAVCARGTCGLLLTSGFGLSHIVIPWNGKPLISKMDNKQHYEIWRCDTTKSGDNWRITKVTSNSTTDNIRPMMPENSDVPILLWMEGEYTTYQNFNTRVRCLVGSEIPTHK